MNVSVKLSALDSQFDPIDPEGTTGPRRQRGCASCCGPPASMRAFINVDMESYDTKDLTLAIFQQVLMEDEFRDWTDVGIVIQCYLRDAERDLVALRDWAASRGTPVWVRLVKGAYWDYETVKAQANGWPVPVFQQKWQTDANFERLHAVCPAKHAALAAGARPATTSARWPTASPRRASWSCRRRRSSCKCCTAWPTPRSRPSSSWGIACGSTCPTAS